jgi:hypothetical protein
LNNVVTDGWSLNFRYLGSHFYELGVTRIIPEK